MNIIMSIYSISYGIMKNYQHIILFILCFCFPRNIVIVGYKTFFLSKLYIRKRFTNSLNIKYCNLNLFGKSFSMTNKSYFELSFSSSDVLIN